MTLAITLGWVGIGGEIRWPVATLRLLLVSFTLVAGDLMRGYQRALAAKQSTTRGN
jgi:hypothetical protein